MTGGTQLRLISLSTLQQRPVRSLVPVPQERTHYLHQFVLHASLDAVDEQVWSTTNMHLGVVDKFNALQVSAFVTAANVKFLLLHDGRSDDAIKLFFRDVYENVYLKVRSGCCGVQLLFHPACHVQTLQTCSKPAWDSCLCHAWCLSLPDRTPGPLQLPHAVQATMNPFFVHTARITSPAFNQRIRTLAKTYFRT